MTTADAGLVEGEDGRAPPEHRRLPARAAEFIRSELAAQVERWFLWTPVAAGIGAALYLGLKTEPSFTAALLAAAGRPQRRSASACGAAPVSGPLCWPCWPSPPAASRGPRSAPA